MNKELLENIDYSEDWILQEIFKNHDEEQLTGKINYVKIKKKDLFNLILKFINLNKKGE